MAPLRLVPLVTEERTPAGRVWLALVLKAHEAVREGAFLRAADLSRLADALEREFPSEVQAERALWDG